jgi:hypothetical protein
METIFLEDPYRYTCGPDVARKIRDVKKDSAYALD